MANFNLKTSKRGLWAIDKIFKGKFLGFGLIEVLIAMAIISITALGVTQLNVAAVQAEGDAVNRRTALMLLQDMADRMRANRRETDNAQNSTYITGGTGVNNLNCIGTGGLTCWTTYLAQQDLWEWNQYITQLLPTGSLGKITFSSAGPPAIFIVSITWPNNKGITQTASIPVQGRS